jgi:replicative DNA helicase
MKETTREAMRVINKMMMSKGEVTGVPSGFKDLDVKTWGFQKQEMIVLAARPGMGKTSLALNFAEAAAVPKRGEPVATLIFSLEMSASQLAMRMLCSKAGVDMQKLRGGVVGQKGEELQQLLDAADEFAKAPIFIDDSSHLSIMELRAKARRLHARHKLGLIIVDYLQLLSPTDAQVPREQQVAEASRGLKALAKELDLPVVVLSQLNRSPEKENRTPRLADLRESGAIEQDADVVLMLTRPVKDSDDGSPASDDSPTELIVAKQRNGPVGELRLTFLRHITRFENYTQ